VQIKLKRFSVQLLLVALVLTTLPVRAAEEPFDIYGILSTTGPAAFYGRGVSAMVSAAERWLNTPAGGNGINGRPIRFVIQDDQSNPATTVALTNQILAKNVAAIFGPAFGATCTAALPIVEKTGPVSYCLSNAIHPLSGSFAFSALPSSRDFTNALFRYVKAKGVKKIALLTSTDSTGQDGETMALENLKLPEFRDLQLVANEHFAVTDLTVAAQMSRIKSAGAEAIDGWSTGPPFGTILRSANEAGFNGIIMTSAGNLNKVQMEQYAQFIPRQLIFSGPPILAIGAMPPRIRVARTTFYDVMHQANVPTDIPQAASWDPLMIIVSGYRRLGTSATAAQMRQYIFNLHDFAGVSGFYDFRKGDQRGLDPVSVVVSWDKTKSEFVTVSQPGGTPFR
jgi:branched-chain amino acid transport system substrate-binding protein